MALGVLAAISIFHIENGTLWFNSVFFGFATFAFGSVVGSRLEVTKRVDWMKTS